MAAPTLWVLLCALLLVNKIVRSNTEEDIQPQDPQLSQSLTVELDQIKARISFLESTINERTRDLRIKDDSITQLEKNIDHKSQGIAALQFDLETLQRQGPLDAKYEAVKAHIRASELEKQVDALQKEINILFKKKDALEAQASRAEKKLQKLNSNLEKLQKINDEQKITILKTERVLRMAEEEIMKAKLEATTLAKELKEVLVAWLPPWIAVPLGDFQSYIMTHWYPRGRSTFDLIIREISDKLAQAWIWVHPHFKTAKTSNLMKKGIPVLKECWWEFVTYLEPHVQKLSKRSIETYYASKQFIAPHVEKVQKLANPYTQEAKRFTESYRPHLDKACAVLKPYTKRLLRLYKNFMKSVAIYHRKVQAGVLEFLKRYELTEAFASNELAWFAASSLFALPVIYLYNLPSVIFRKKRYRRKIHSHTHQTHRRLKRTHHDR